MATTASGTAGLLLMNSKTAFGSTANSRITLGVIGSGGRSHFVCKKFLKTVEEEIQLVSAHDYFQSRLDAMQNLFEIEPSKCYTGLDGYRKILDSDVDGVIITSPPYYHPEHASDAVDAGKHIWLCKPVAIDVPGSLSIKESGRRADGKLAFLVDFQTRNSPFFMDAVKRVRDGAIGKLVAGEAFNQFPCAGKRPDTPGLTDDQARLRYWGTDPILSGDIIVEQAVHAVDVVNWLVGANPTKAYGAGGLKVRTENGANWDHFIVTYWYGDGPIVDLNCSQFMRGYENLGARIFGATGTVHAHYRAKDWGTGPVSITGDNAWPGTPNDNTWDIGVENNCRDFVRAIRTGEYMNHAEYAADSTLTAVLGRIAAYAGREVTWDEMLKAGEKLDAKLEL